MDSESQLLCNAVRKFKLPPTGDIVIIVLAVLVVLINSLEIISVLRNYRRLRQRIYVFVISLGLADILGGVIFLSDAVNRIVIRNSEDDIDQLGAVYQTLTEQGRKFVAVDEIGKDFSQELLETLKAGCIVLSVLNTTLVTFALYKRTTSMGRHHEDFKSMDPSLGPDGHPFLPAFDTMMRVLSIGSPAVVNGINKGNPRTNMMMHSNNNSPIRRVSSVSKMSTSSIQPDEPGSGTRKNQVIRSSTENSARKQKPKRSGSMGRLLNNTGRRVSHAFRHRSSSGAQPYVGRHSNSVMSKGATSCSLFLIWLTFIIVCAVPLGLRRIEDIAFVCPESCQAAELTEVILKTNSSLLPSRLVTSVSISLKKSDVTEGGGVFQNGSTAVPNGILIQPDDSSISSTEANGIISADVKSTFTSGCIPTSYQRGITIVNKTTLPVEITKKSPCSSCSTAFYPSSKSLMIFVTLAVFLTWCWLIVSASRLLYLRKHSTNVFVRCSALWRFMFMTAVFSLATMMPYIIWIVLDFVTASSLDKSPIWYSTPTQDPLGYNTPDLVNPAPDSSNLDWVVAANDNEFLKPIFGIISTCLLLVNFAVAPSLYFIRLLGFRRIISAL